MSYLKMSLDEFIKQVDSNSPAPGGGSVSALASTLGIALTRMMGSLAINKKKYNELDEIIKDEFNSKLDKLKVIRKKLSILIDEDTKVFNELMAAYKLPKETEEEKKIRSEKIQVATLRATEVPYEVAKVSMEAMELFPFFSEHGNLNAISDLGVGAMLLETGIKGAILNVKINVSGLKNEAKVEWFKIRYEKLEEEATALREAILEFVEKRLSF
jgi:formiminotetrahydrofolate cyclodeaminase